MVVEVGWTTGVLDMIKEQKEESRKMLAGTKSYLDRLIKEYGADSLVTDIIESELQK